MQDSFLSLLEKGKGSEPGCSLFLDKTLPSEFVYQVLSSLKEIDDSLSHPYYSFFKRSKDFMDSLKAIRLSLEEIGPSSSFTDEPLRLFFDSVYSVLLARLESFRASNFFEHCSSHEKSKMISYKKTMTEDISHEINALKNFFLTEEKEEESIRKQDHSLVSEETVMSCIRSAVQAMIKKEKKILYGRKVCSSVWILVCYALGKSPDELPMKASHCSYINFLLLTLSR